MLQNSAIASLPCPMSAIFTQLDILLYHILRILHSKSTKHFVMQYLLPPRAAFLSALKTAAQTLFITVTTCTSKITVKASILSAAYFV